MSNVSFIKFLGVLDKSNYSTRQNMGKAGRARGPGGRDVSWWKVREVPGGHSGWMPRYRPNINGLS